MDIAGSALKDFFGTVALIALLSVAYGLVLRSRHRPWLGRSLLGLCFGGASVLAMFDPVAVVDGVIMDMRNLPVLLAGAFLGVQGALVATAMAVAMRFGLGGMGAPAGMAALAISALAGLLWARWTATTQERRLRSFASLALLVPAPWAATFLMPPDLAGQFLSAILPYFAPLEIAGALMVGALFERERCLAEERRRLTWDADRDPLTSLLNRRGFERAVGRLPLRQGGALLLLDLDHFKRINDLHGHSGGDAVLLALGDRLARVLGRQDIVARLGGEEFAVFLPGRTPKGARDLARRLCEALRSEPFALPGGDTVTVTASVGGAWGAPASLEALTARADAALYAAKRAGRDRCRFASEGPALAGKLLDVETGREGCPLRPACARGTEHGRVPLLGPDDQAAVA